LHATIARLKKELDQLTDTQRKLREAHSRLEETFRRIIRKEPNGSR
jgi:prefoldin subunit 5